MSYREDDIVDFVGETYAQRGRGYFEEGRIQSPRIEQGRLRAECWGARSSPYEVQVELEGDAIVGSRCSCPVREPCKHVAALLYANLEEGEAVARPDLLRERLWRLPREALVEAIMEFAERSSEAERFLERRLLEADAEFEADAEEIRGHAERAFRSAFEQASGHGLEAVISEVVDELERLAAVGARHRDAGRPREALAVWGPLAEVAAGHDFEGGRGLDELFGFLQGLQAELVALLEELEDPEDRRRVFDVLWQLFELDLRHGGVELARPVWHAVDARATEEERNELVERARTRCEEERSSDWPDRRTGRLLLRFVDTFGDATVDLEQRVDDYEVLGAAGDLVDLLLREGAVERARERAAAVEYARDFVSALERFVHHDRPGVAEELARDRLEGGGHEHPVQNWLIDHLAGDERRDEALEVALEMLEQHANREVYERVEMLAVALDRWEEVRPRARATLREDAPRVYLQQLIREGALEEAVEFWRDVFAEQDHEAWRASDVELELADRIERTHPDTAARIWALEANTLLETDNADHYRRVAELLARARSALRDADREPRWEEIRAEVLQGNRMQAKLAAALEEAGIERP